MWKIFEKLSGKKGKNKTSLLLENKKKKASLSTCCDQIVSAPTGSQGHASRVAETLKLKLAAALLNEELEGWVASSHSSEHQVCSCRCAFLCCFV